MKKNLLTTTLSLFLAFSMIFSLSNCSKEVQNPALSADASAAMKSPASLNLEKNYMVNFQALNHSGVSGTAKLWLQGDKLTVEIEAMGLEMNRLHPQHIHGFKENNKNATCPTASADTDGDGIISLAEGLPSYGPVLLSLTDFPTADAEGNIHYRKEFTITPDLLPLQNRAIVLHGMTVNGEYVATLPVACGQVKSWNE